MVYVVSMELVAELGCVKCLILCEETYAYAPEPNGKTEIKFHWSQGELPFAVQCKPAAASEAQGAR